MVWKQSFWFWSNIFVIYFVIGVCFTLAGQYFSMTFPDGWTNEYKSKLIIYTYIYNKENNRFGIETMKEVVLLNDGRIWGENHFGFLINTKAGERSCNVVHTPVVSIIHHCIIIAFRKTQIIERRVERKSSHSGMLRKKLPATGQKRKLLYKTILNLESMIVRSQNNWLITDFVSCPRSSLVPNIRNCIVE